MGEPAVLATERLYAQPSAHPPKFGKHFTPRLLLLLAPLLLLLHYYPFSLQAVFWAPMGVHALRWSSEAPKVEAL